ARHLCIRSGGGRGPGARTGLLDLSPVAHTAFRPGTGRWDHGHGIAVAEARTALSHAFFRPLLHDLHRAHLCGRPAHCDFFAASAPSLSTLIADTFLRLST